jgi:hypothetical protein
MFWIWPLKCPVKGMHLPHHIDSAFSLIGMTFGVIVIPVIVLGTLFLAAK